MRREFCHDLQVLFEYWIVGFLIYEVVGELFEIKKCLRKHMNEERWKVLTVLLRDKQEVKWGDF